MDVANSSILFDVDVESLRAEVHRHHLAGLDDSALLRQVSLAEVLVHDVSNWI